MSSAVMNWFWLGARPVVDVHTEEFSHGKIERRWNGCGKIPMGLRKRWVQCQCDEQKVRQKVRGEDEKKWFLFLASDIYTK